MTGGSRTEALFLELYMCQGGGECSGRFAGAEQGREMIPPFYGVILSS